MALKWIRTQAVKIDKHKFYHKLYTALLMIHDISNIN